MDVQGFDVVFMGRDSKCDVVVDCGMKLKCGLNM